MDWDFIQILTWTSVCKLFSGPLSDTVATRSNIPFGFVVHMSKLEIVIKHPVVDWILKGLGIFKGETILRLKLMLELIKLSGSKHRIGHVWVPKTERSSKDILIIESLHIGLLSLTSRIFKWKSFVVEPIWFVKMTVMTTNSIISLSNCSWTNIWPVLRWMDTNLLDGPGMISYESVSELKFGKI